MPTRKATTELEPAKPMGLEEVKRALLDPTVKLTLADEDPDVVRRQIMERTLNARSVDDLWDAEPVSGKDIAGKVFELRSVTFRNSELESSDGLSIFAVMNVVYETGEIGIVTCGAAGVVTRLVKLIEFGALPIWLTIRSKKTRSGNDVLDLFPVSEDQRL